jgi:hypothetical protein
LGVHVQDGLCLGPCNSRYVKARALYGKALADWSEAMAARAVAYETSPPGTDLGPEPARPEEPRIRPWLGEPTWCRRCTAMIHAELSELDDLIAMLLAIPDLRAGADQAGKVSGTRGQRSPSPYADDADELAEWLRSWESLARGTDPAPRRGYLAAEITATAAWLVTHFEPLITNPDLAADYGNEIRGWHRTLKMKAHAGSATKHMPRPCPRCRLYTLWATDGEDYVVCKNEDCRRLMSREEYRDLTEDRVIHSVPQKERRLSASPPPPSSAG